MVPWLFYAMSAKKKQLKKMKIDPEVQEIYVKVSKWQIEANSGHNDGYVRKFYSDKIKQLKKLLFPKKNPKLIT